MKILGITGPSGSGKTTLCSLIQKNYDAFIIDADNVAKSLSSNTETEYFREIVNLFGNEALRPDGNLNRKEVAKIIYNDNEKRKALNLLTFKYVVDDIEKQIRSFENSNNFNYIAIDVPLLYEAKMENICDKVIAVVAEDKEKVLRICMRDNIDEKLARQRLQIQNNNEFFVKKADFVIHNDGTIDKLEKSLKEIIEKI